MTKMILFGCAREQSTRCSNKMTSPFGNSTLFEIYLKKFEEISKLKNPFDDIMMAISPSDENLWNMCRNSSIKILERNPESVAKGYRGAIDLYGTIKNYECDHVMIVSGCFPFIKTETIIKVAEFFKSRNNQLKSLVCVRERRNHFWNTNSVEQPSPINNKDPTCLSTNMIPPILENVNHTNIFNKEYLFNHGCYWDYSENNPYLYIVPDDEECLDIDNQLDFSICEGLYNSGKY